MSLKYSVFYYVHCDHAGCLTETETMIDAKRVTDDAEAAGWSTPDGITWYCPEHKEVQQ